ncbi:hypothetical protein BDN72DRAFT_298244 [Pluteus cervinus]|uniref:Uncharacterized protein n=1 Tax=Pluteus cervinus TaxID=181527 RepID=A0ACD3AEP4_9AGAR|nr:hypothetical protein BDN72DRAFT_298244 [Pluteus cervinus]
MTSPTRESVVLYNLTLAYEVNIWIVIFLPFNFLVICTVFTVSRRPLHNTDACLYISMTATTDEWENDSLVLSMHCPVIGICGLTNLSTSHLFFDCTFPDRSSSPVSAPTATRTDVFGHFLPAFSHHTSLFLWICVGI